MIRTTFLLLLFGTWGSMPSLAQTDVPIHTGIHGSVELPATSSQTSNRFRGRAYRNRSATSEDNTHSESTANSLTSIIVSLHPLSFQPEVTPLAEPVQIYQLDAVFIPEVTAVTVGSVVQFINNDPFFHNVFSLTPGARFNIGRRPTGDITNQTIPALKWKVEGLGPISLYCDIHSQMSAIILSLDTPYFTRVQEDGTFDLGDVPAGTYELRAYHPKFELLIRQLTIAEGEVSELNLQLQ